MTESTPGAPSATEQAVKAAKEYVSTPKRSDYDDPRDYDYDRHVCEEAIQRLAAIIDAATGLPDLLAENAGLKAENVQLWKMLSLLNNSVVSFFQAVSANESKDVSMREMIKRRRLLQVFSDQSRVVLARAALNRDENGEE